jgi:hypothetical protein
MVSGVDAIVLDWLSVDPINSTCTFYAGVFADKGVGDCK